MRLFVVLGLNVVRCSYAYGATECVGTSRLYEPRQNTILWERIGNSRIP